MKTTQLTFLFLFSLVTVSCGFHLRGSQDFSKVLPEINIVGVNKFSDLGRDLARSLATAHVNVFDESSTILNVTKNTFSKRVISVDNAGRANQYQLMYDISFTLVNKVKNEEDKIIDLIPAQSITETREYLFDADLIIAKENEENRLKQDMRQALILQLMRRLKFLLKTKVNK